MSLSIDGRKKNLKIVQLKIDYIQLGRQYVS